MLKWNRFAKLFVYFAITLSIGASFQPANADVIGPTNGIVFSSVVVSDTFETIYVAGSFYGELREIQFVFQDVPVAAVLISNGNTFQAEFNLDQATSDYVSHLLDDSIEVEIVVAFRAGEQVAVNGKLSKPDGVCRKPPCPPNDGLVVFPGSIFAD